MVEFLIDNAADLHQTDSYEESPLHVAVHGGESLDLIEFLIEKGADVHAVNKNKENVLFMTKNKEIILYFINKGVDVNAKNYKDQTPLLRHYQDISIIETLLKAGADINQHDDYGSLLHRAAEDPELIEFLLKKNIDPNITDEYGDLAVYQYAKYYEGDISSNKKEKILMKLLEKTTLNK